MGCQTVWSEDLNHGQNYDGILVINPFLAAALPPATSTELNSPE
jgi:hypothetical protein